LFAAEIFDGKIKNLEKLLGVFENSSINTRYFVNPPAWYKKERSFREMNEIFAKEALILSLDASRKAIERAGIKKDDIGMVIFVSSTGIVTPSLDAKIIEELKLSPHTRRLPVWGLGCAGGVAGIARAAELSVSLDGKAVLLIAAELCSLTFQRSDYSKSNLVAASIFADGAAAAVIACEDGGKGLSIHGSHSALFPGTEDIMGWDVVDTGLKVRFSRDIPALVKEHLPNVLSDAKNAWGIKNGDIFHYVAHPGGTKVLAAYSESLKINSGKFYNSQKILNDYGNMSSATVLFVLERFLKVVEATGEFGVMLALGPGFSAEQALFKW
jgi:alkylresorcinol/alkylpyrone synthase